MLSKTQENSVLMDHAVNRLQWSAVELKVVQLFLLTEWLRQVNCQMLATFQMLNKMHTFSACRSQERNSSSSILALFLDVACSFEIQTTRCRKQDEMDPLTCKVCCNKPFLQAHAEFTHTYKPILWFCIKIILSFWR